MYPIRLEFCPNIVGDSLSLLGGCAHRSPLRAESEIISKS